LGAPKTLILIRTSERVEDSIIIKIIEFLFQHGSKPELKRLRYFENRAKHISSVPKVITFDLFVGISISLVFWKLDIHTFLRTPRPAQSEIGKTFKKASKFGGH